MKNEKKIEKEKIETNIEVKKMKDNPEKIPLLLVYKEDGQLKTDVSSDVNDYELWGFLKLFTDRMGEFLKENIEEREDDEELI